MRERGENQFEKEGRFYLYKPLPKNKQYKTYGYYIQQAKKLLEKDLISMGKYEQLLLSAFRPDLVYGDDLEGSELND